MEVYLNFKWGLNHRKDGVKSKTNDWDFLVIKRAFRTKCPSYFMSLFLFF